MKKEKSKKKKAKTQEASPKAMSPEIDSIMDLFSVLGIIIHRVANAPSMLFELVDREEGTKKFKKRVDKKEPKEDILKGLTQLSELIIVADKKAKGIVRFREIVDEVRVILCLMRPLIDNAIYKITVTQTGPLKKCSDGQGNLVDADEVIREHFLQTCKRLNEHSSELKKLALRLYYKVESVDTGKPQKTDKKKEEYKVSGEIRALDILSKHPDWSLKKVAEEARLHPKSLSRYSRFKILRNYIIAESKQKIPRGRRLKNGDIEAED